MSTRHNEDLWKKRKVKRERPPEPIVEYKAVRVRCTCDDFCDDPCPAHPNPSKSAGEQP